MELLTANIRGKVRREVLNGRAYTVAPLTMMVPGVLDGSKGPLLYPPDEVSRDPMAWNHMPMVVNHPTKHGRPVSARRPDILNEYGIGYVFEAHANGSLQAEGWFDDEKTLKIRPDILSNIRRGIAVELSTGLFTDNEEEEGVFNGKQYDGIARNYRPDHLAILPDTTGACSLRDGCGVLNESASQPVDNGGPGSGNFGHYGRPGFRGGSAATQLSQAAHEATKKIDKTHMFSQHRPAASDKAIIAAESGKSLEAARLHELAASFHAKEAQVTISERGHKLHRKASEAHQRAANAHEREAVEQDKQTNNGGPGSGNFGHKGRPGQQGGSIAAGSEVSWTHKGKRMQGTLSYITKLKGRKRALVYVAGTGHVGVNPSKLTKARLADMYMPKTPEAAVAYLDTHTVAELTQKHSKEHLRRITDLATNSFYGHKGRPGLQGGSLAADKGGGSGGSGKGKRKFSARKMEPHFDNISRKVSEKYAYIVHGVHEGVHGGKSPQEAFDDAIENENYHGDREDVRADREAAAKLINKAFGMKIDPHHLYPGPNKTNNQRSKDGHSGSSVTNGEPDMAKLTDKEREAILNELCTNCGCKDGGPWTPEDKPLLNEMGDKQLVKLHADTKTAVENAKKLKQVEEEFVVNSDGKFIPKKKEEPDPATTNAVDDEAKWLATAPASVRSLINNAKKIDTQRRTAAVKVIVANKGNKFTEEFLLNGKVGGELKFDTDELEAMASLAGGNTQEEDRGMGRFLQPNYAGAAGGAVQNSRGGKFDEDDDSMAPPTINYAEEAKARQTA